MSKTPLATIDIDTMCMESYPCQHHYVLIYEDGTEERGLADGPSIYKMYVKAGFEVPQHFQEYGEEPFPRSADGK